MPPISLSSGQNKKMLFTAVFLYKLKELFIQEKKEEWFCFVQSVALNQWKLVITTRKPALNSWLLTKKVLLNEVFFSACKTLVISHPEEIIIIFR